MYPTNSEDASMSTGLLFQMRSPHLSCMQCAQTLECVEQNRRSGTWLGSLLCPNCRSEYFYAYRWGRLMRKS